MSDLYVRKRREPCVLFLDDCFDAEDAPRRLRELGYSRVEVFVDHFKRTSDGGKEQSVKDPSVLRLCDEHGWLLVTTDSDIRFTHVEEMKRCSNLAVLATSHNRVMDLDVWVEALGQARARVEREFKNFRRPWFGQFNRQGKITTIYTVTEEHSSRRNRPGEVDGDLS